MSQLAFPLLLNFAPTPVLYKVLVSVLFCLPYMVLCLHFTGAVKCFSCQVIREEVLDICNLLSLPGSSISGKYTLNKVSSKQVSPKCIVPYRSLQIQQKQPIHTECMCLLSKKAKKKTLDLLLHTHYMCLNTFTSQTLSWYFVLYVQLVIWQTLPFVTVFMLQYLSTFSIVLSMNYFI